jgi:uncharacterized protein YndB with AHSA1/START domain
MKSTGGFNVTLPSDDAILVTRSFEAPRAAVFDAWTNAEKVKHWWDPNGIPLVACEIDLRPGGSFSWVNRTPDGEHEFAGTYREVTPPERLVFTVRVHPSAPEALTTLIFSEDGNATKLTMRIDCASVEERNALLQMRVDAGTSRTLENLATYLDEIQTYETLPLSQLQR